MKIKTEVYEVEGDDDRTRVAVSFSTKKARSTFYLGYRAAKNLARQLEMELDDWEEQVTSG